MSDKKTDLVDPATVPKIEAAPTPFEPTSIEGVEKLAQLLQSADMLPREYVKKPGNILIACMMGQRTGIGWWSAMQGLAVVNGKPSWYGGYPLLLAQRSEAWDASKHREGYIEAPPGYEGTTLQDVNSEGRAIRIIGAFFECARTGSEAVRSTFTIEDAQTAGLWGKSGPWKQYPKWMLMYRARGYLIRQLFSDALAGCHIKEELIDVPQPEPEPAGATGAERLESRLLQRRAAKDAEQDVEDAEFAPTAEIPIDPPKTIMVPGRQGLPVPHTLEQHEEAGEPAAHDQPGLFGDETLDEQEAVQARIKKAASDHGIAASAVLSEAGRIAGKDVERLGELSLGQQKALADVLEALAG